MGADEAVLISAREFGGADTYATSSTITAAIRKIGVEEGDIVFCGRQAIDGDTAQVGPQIAEKLDIPQVTQVLQALNGLGVPVDPAVYTMKDAVQAILACREKGGSRPC